MHSRIRIAVADDQALFVSGMKLILESESDLEFVGSAHDGESALALVFTEKPDVMLMDVRMNGLGGIEALARIHDEPVGALPTKVIMLTTFRSGAALADSIRHGASGFITKDATPVRVFDAIRTVHAGQTVFSAEVMADLFAPASDTRATGSTHTVKSPLQLLSPREREIVLLTAKGLSNAEVASAAFVSTATVKTHLGNALGKLGLRTRSQLVVFAYENGLMQPE